MLKTVVYVALNGHYNKTPPAQKRNRNVPAYQTPGKTEASRQQYPGV